LSDTLGRLQTEIRLLTRDLDHGARAEAGSRSEVAARVEVVVGFKGRSDASGVAANWPYLAL
jgi:hypothetical protein